MTIDPSLRVTGPEWSVAPIENDAAPESGSGFGKLLGDQLGALTKTQTDAASAARDLATGKATDPTAVVMAVERAQLAMQLASQIRTKGVESFQSIMQTQV